MHWEMIKQMQNLFWPSFFIFAIDFVSSVDAVQRGQKCLELPRPNILSENCSRKGKIIKCSNLPIMFNHPFCPSVLWTLIYPKLSHSHQFELPWWHCHWNLKISFVTMIKWNPNYLRASWSASKYLLAIVNKSCKPFEH